MAGHAEIAEVLERSEAACRQLAVRARGHVQTDRPRFPTDEPTRDRLVTAFMAAVYGGNVAGLVDLLTDGAVLYIDGGGKRPAAPAPIHGRANIMAFFTAIGLGGGGRLSTASATR